MSTEARHLTCVDDGVPEATTMLLRAACAARSVIYHRFDPRGFDPAETPALRPGALLYRPAISAVAIRAEQQLYAAGVATFYADSEGPLFGYTNSTLLFAGASLPTPRSLPLTFAGRDRLRAHVAALGGLPVVVKLPGGSGGVGTLRVDSLPALFSLADTLLAQGHQPLLMAYVPAAEHWRVVVVGARAVAAYRNVTDADDFRTHAGNDPADYTAAPPAELAELAVLGVQALRLEFGGVDILRHASGRLYLLEANFPCYFATAQDVAGIDIAGPMIDHLLLKSVG